jgi:hypothetical protein
VQSQVSALSKVGMYTSWCSARRLVRSAPCDGTFIVLARHSDQVLDAILTMADRQGLFLARKVKDPRRKVLELAAIIEVPDVFDRDA